MAIPLQVDKQHRSAAGVILGTLLSCIAAVLAVSTFVLAARIAAAAPVEGLAASFAWLWSCFFSMAGLIGGTASLIALRRVRSSRRIRIAALVICVMAIVLSTVSYSLDGWAFLTTVS